MFLRRCARDGFLLPGRKLRAHAEIQSFLIGDDLGKQLNRQISFFGAGTAWLPVWSPTSDAVAFVSNESHNDEIWVAQKGEWPAIKLTHNKYEWDHHPSWSPDGKQLIFSSNRVTGKNGLWIMDADGGNERELVKFEFEAWDPIWVKYTDQ